MVSQFGSLGYTITGKTAEAKLIQEFGWTSQGMDWGWVQGIKSTTHRRVKEFGYSCRQRRLTWAKRRRTGLLNWTKSTKSRLNDHGVGVLDWPAKRIYGVLSRGKWETRDQKMQMTWRPLSKKPGLPYHLSSATNWSPPCHAELRQ